MEITITLIFKLSDERRDVVVELWETMEEIFEREEIHTKETASANTRRYYNTPTCYQMDYREHSAHNIYHNYFSNDKTRQKTSHQDSSPFLQQKIVEKNVDCYFIAYQGRIVNPIMSLLHEGITKTGSKLIIVEKSKSRSFSNEKVNKQIRIEKELTKFGCEIKEYQKKVSFLRNNTSGQSFDNTNSTDNKLNNIVDDCTSDDTFINQKKEVPFNDILKTSKLIETLRINDQIWTTWETAKGHDVIIRMMMSQIENNALKNQSMENENNYIPMNIEKAKEICCKPLPNCFSGKPLNGYGILMAEYPDMGFRSSQPENNNNGFNPEASQF